MPWGRRVRRPCRAAAGAGSPGGGIRPAGEAGSLRGLGSGRCSPAGPPVVPEGRSGTGFPAGSPLSRGEGAEGGSWAGCPAHGACRGAGARWDPEGRGDTEAAAWSDGQSHQDLRRRRKKEAEICVQCQIIDIDTER